MPTAESRAEVFAKKFTRDAAGFAAQRIGLQLRQPALTGFAVVDAGRLPRKIE
jgi:hypothetical protein